MVFREPDSRRFQPLPEVQGKGKEKVIDEQAAHDLLTLQNPKKKSSADQFIFQRCTLMSTEPSGNAESPSLDAELALTDNETDSDKEVPPVNTEKDASYKELTEINTGVQDEGQARPNLGKQDEGQAGSNPGPISSTRTLSSLQNLDKELSFTNQFFVEKPPEEEPEKTNTESEVQSMVTVPNHQDTSLVPPMTTPVINLTLSQPVSTTVHALLPTSTTTTTTIIAITTLPPPPPQPQQSTTDLILLRHIGELEQHMADLLQKNLALEERLDKHGSRLSPSSSLSDLPTVDMKEILQQWMFEDNSYKAHEVHENLFEALEKSLECNYSNQLLADVDEARMKKRKRRNSPRTPSGSPPSQPPPPPPPAGASGAPGTSRASGSSQFPLPPPPPSTGTSGSAQQRGSRSLSSSKIAASTPESMAWTTSDTRYESASDDFIPYEHVQLSDDEDNGNDHIPKANKRKNWWKPLSEEERPATLEPAWTIPSSNMSDVENNWASVLVSTYEPPAENSLLAKTRDMTTFMNWYYRHVTIQTQFFFNKDLEYLRYGNKGNRPALSISKMKAARYPDFGFELLVPEQMWIDDVCTYDKSAKYGISHLWFNRQKFNIDKHDSLSRQREVRTHMRIFSVDRIKAYSRYRYDYLMQLS
ncbi:hypothetical protein Tco_0393280 [Tanacetum coccineum]